MLQVKWPTCPQGQLLKCARGLNFKQLIQGTHLNLILIRNMSVAGSNDVKEQDYKWGKVNQKPPIG